MARNLNVVVGIDAANKHLKIMRIYDTNVKDVTVDILPFSARVFDKNFFEEFDRLLAQYLLDKPSLAPSAVYLVLPDSAVAMDCVSIPFIKKKKMDETLNVELQTLYKNYKDLICNRYIISQNKQFVTYVVTLLRKELLSECFKTLSQNKLYSKNATYESNALLNSVFYLRPKLKGKSFYFLDIKEDHTVFAFSNKGHTSGFASMDIGYEALESSRVHIEAMLYNHDVAELAVLNAQEQAKAKMLTLSETEIMMKSLDDAAEIAQNLPSAPPEIPEGYVNASSDNAEPAVTEPVPETELDAPAVEEKAEAAPAEEPAAVTAPEADDKADDGDDADAELELEAEDAAEPEEEKEEARSPMTPKKVKVFVKKVPKKLPKFMQRPIPETQEGVAVENFRIFVKRVLLYKQAASHDETLTTPEFVLVNIPEKFAFILDEVNKDAAENGVEFRRLDVDTDGSVEVARNLELYGATVMKSFNQTQNF